ncbi:thioesterase [Paractinoplanes abujensis]|uniref:Acyl-CoA thioester hydrolase n=1 Tax=Paractinoplanes abujensis TaxID=882441 RepID=A0A7W7CPZ9_9ACTN|nr:hotdog domain-containing protein [Actinoplanes abujensis]MBB4691128.1 acyl-CoA thioester hydrolase [Actinoplanes abujensis]GID17458.1 thioesterase [Actinoplanes abujensis]
MTTTAVHSHGAVVRQPVHFDDLDAMGILHNSRYAVLVERAIVIWWTERGVSFSGGRPTTPDAFNVVRDYQITFHRPVRGTGEVEIRFWLDRMGTTSADYAFQVTSADGATVHAEGRRVNIRLDPATMRPAPWTDHGRAVAAALLRA